MTCEVSLQIHVDFVKLVKCILKLEDEPPSVFVSSPSYLRQSCGRRAAQYDHDDNDVVVFFNNLCVIFALTSGQT